ncbi:ABC transporter permease [Lactobacillus salsicarnum]|nr:ABC transporter permease [Companilactobacillus mishanensis]
MLTTLIKQELYKISKRKTTYILPIITIVFMFLAAIMIKNVSESGDTAIDSAAYFVDLYSGLTWVVYLMIFAGSTIITQEFEFGTIKNLLYRKYSRTEILISKWMTLLIMNICYFVMTIIVSVFLKFIFYSDVTFDMTINNHSLFSAMLMNVLGNFLVTWIVLSLVLMISTLFKNSAVSVSVGIVFYFGASVLSMFQTLAIQKWDWLKWNPLNMLNVGRQVQSPEMHQMTQLSTNSMIIASFVYIIIFLAIGYYAFRSRKNI